MRSDLEAHGISERAYVEDRRNGVRAGVEGEDGEGIGHVEERVVEEGGAGSDLLGKIDLETRARLRAPLEALLQVGLQTRSLVGEARQLRGDAVRLDESDAVRDREARSEPRVHSQRGRAVRREKIET